MRTSAGEWGFRCTKADHGRGTKAGTSENHRVLVFTTTGFPLVVKKTHFRDDGSLRESSSN